MGYEFEMEEMKKEHNAGIAEDKFETWAILELFGHKRLAGLVSEVTIAGGAFMRIEVPDANGQIEYTRFYNPSAIYSISPTDRAIAVALAQKIKEPPITVYDLARFQRSLPVGALDFEGEE